MQKTYREGVNVKVAFDIASSQAPMLSNEKNLSILDHAKLKLKRFVYKLLKPIIRSLVYRIRRYLINSLEQSLQSIQAQSTNTTLALKEEMKKHKQEIILSIEKNFMAVNKRIFIANQLQENVNHTNDTIIIVGAGGYAKSIVDLLQANGETVADCTGNAKDKDTCLNIKVLSIK